MAGVRGSISIKDNVTAVLQNVKKEQRSFRRDVEKTRKSLSEAYDKKRKIKINASPASKTIKKLKKDLQPLRNKIVKTVAIKDLATGKIKSVKSKLKVLAKMPFTPVVAIKDKVAGGLGKIKSALSKIAKPILIPISVAGGAAVAGIGKSMKMGMELEQQKISMKHFIGTTNKDMSEKDVNLRADKFTKQLRDNANATPFETGEVMGAGSRAVALTGGNTKEAMKLVTLAEDMAAASGGTKDISQAIEALGDAKMGEMERLKEFGFKVSKEEFDAKGFEGVADDLSDFYGGAADKLATSGAGLLSTISGKIKSNISDFGLNLTEKFKPELENIITLIDEYAPLFESVGETLANGIFKGFERLGEIKENLFVMLEPLMPYIMSVKDSIMEMLPSISTIVEGTFNIIGNVIQTFAPVVMNIISSIMDKVANVSAFIASKMPFIQSVIANAMPVIKDILVTAWNVINPCIDIGINTFKILFSVVQRVFPGIQRVIQTTWSIIKPLISAIGKGLETVSKGLKWVSGKISGGGGGKVAKNAKGDNNFKGGLTWVGEKGPELIELPHGTRILPNKESLNFVKEKKDGHLDNKVPIREKETASSLFKPIPINASINPVKEKEVANKPYYDVVNETKNNKTMNNNVTVNIPKLADHIIVREEADIDKISEEFYKKLKLAGLVV